MGVLSFPGLYDAWGQQSVLQVGSNSQLFVQSLQRRAYTGHENVEGLGIIHMNGRIYDPLLARFVQADPTLQFVQYSQGYNRYSYVLNNPMSYTDPSGYFLKKLMQVTGVTAAMKFLAKNPFLNAIAQVVVAYYGGPLGVALFSFAQSYTLTGNLGQGLRSGAIAYASAWAVGQVGANTGVGDFGNVVGNGVIGGISSELQGGQFGHGFVSAGLGASLGGLGGNVRNPFGQVLVSAVIGGTISKVTGGKFMNGAGSAAFATALWIYQSGIRHKHAVDDNISENDKVANNDSRTKIFLRRGKTTLNLDISNELDVLIDGLKSKSNTFADDILREFGNGSFSVRIDADYGLKYAGIYDPKTTNITMNPNSYYGSAGRAQLILGHELIHFRDGPYADGNTTEINAYSWEKRVLSNYISPRTSVLDYSSYKNDLNNMIDSYGGG